MWWTHFLCLIVLLQSVTAFISESYLGCYNENITRKQVEEPLIDSQNMTRSFCAQYCRSRNLFSYALKYGTYCYCSTDTTVFTEFGLAEGNECTKLCVGAPMCGGNKFMAVYNGSKYFKCLPTDDPSFREFGGKIDNLTIDTCLKICGDLFQYSFLLQGNKCYCSDTIPSSEPVEDEKCLTEGEICLGEQRCGGGAGVIAVWKIENSTQCCRGEDANNGSRNKESFADLLKEYFIWTILGAFTLGFISAFLISYGRQTYFVRSRISKIKKRIRRKKTQKKIKSLIDYKDDSNHRRSVHCIEEAATRINNASSRAEAETYVGEKNVKIPKPPKIKKGLAYSRYIKKSDEETPAPRVSIYHDAELYTNIVLNNKIMKPSRKKQTVVKD